PARVAVMSPVRAAIVAPVVLATPGAWAAGEPRGTGTGEPRETGTGPSGGGACRAQRRPAAGGAAGRRAAAPARPAPVAAGEPAEADQDQRGEDPPLGRVPGVHPGVLPPGRDRAQRRVGRRVLTGELEVPVVQRVRQV